MKILIDIGHPAHIHYFRNAIQALQQKGHKFLITTRDKEIAIDLLKSYGFSYICTGKNKGGILNKVTGMLRNIVAIYRAARKFKPDVFFSFYSPFAAQVGWLMRKPVIGFADTEFAKLSIKLTKPFTTYSFTPACFTTELGTNHFRFRGYMETFYLHPRYFTPDEEVLQKLGIDSSTPFFLMRFVSFTAGHDIGETGIDDRSKLLIAEYLSKRGKLFISSEGKLPPQFEQYRLKSAPRDFHHLLAFATLYVGEGITTASECAHLGTPAVLINSLSTGYIHEEAAMGLLYYLKNADGALEKVKEILETPNAKEIFKERKEVMLRNTIDCTEFLTWLLDTFPGSIGQLLANKENSIISNLPTSKTNGKLYSSLSTAE